MANDTEVKPKIGRPLTVIPWYDVDKLCRIQCTGEEIASYIDCDYDTLQTACKREKGVPFSEYIQQKKLGGKASLRRRQWLTAEAGNPTMLVWLGKNVLGQKDQPEPDDEGQEALPLTLQFTVTNAVTDIKITNAPNANP